MDNLNDIMINTSFVEDFFAYLMKEHGVSAWVEDSQGELVEIGETTASPLACTRFYPFDSCEDFGGVRCAAETEEALSTAEPHILIGVKGISHLLMRDIDLMQTSDEMLQLSSQMTFLFKFSQKALGINQINTFCRLLLNEIAPSIQADFGVVNLTKQDNQSIDILHNIGNKELARLREIGLDQITSQSKTVIISSLKNETSVLYCPIKDKTGPIGYLACFKNPGKPSFSSYEKKFVMIIEHIISPIVEATQLYESLQNLYLNTVRTLAAAIDAKDQYTHGHSSRVAWFSKAIGKELGISDDESHNLDVAAYMHDLGKIGIAESILGKPGKLTDEEFNEIKKHPVLTYKILEPISLAPSIVDAAVQHHERLDGKGYPYGLKGDQVSPLARIISVADVFDALTSKRPYRDCMTVEKALGIICDDVGTMFDKRMVQALLKFLKHADIEKDHLADAPDLLFTDIGNLDHFLTEMQKKIDQVDLDAQADQAQESASLA